MVTTQVHVGLGRGTRPTRIPQPTAFPEAPRAALASGQAPSVQARPRLADAELEDLVIRLAVVAGLSVMALLVIVVALLVA